ncbi:MAG: hypothetical protein D6798_18830, partial [Deltaproteobacteria bacterium]
DVARIFDEMARRFDPTALDGPRTYYFSIGEVRRTVKLDKGGCTVEEGRTVDDADCVLKADPKLFVDMVTRGRKPGPLDIARGRIKTNDPDKLRDLSRLFRF